MFHSEEEEEAEGKEEKEEEPEKQEYRIITRIQVKERRKKID